MGTVAKICHCLLLITLIQFNDGRFWNRCPKKCKCRSSWIRGVTTVVVDCSARNLVAIPTIKEGLPRDVTRLILYKNYLQEIPANAFRGLNYLKELYLYENFISKIDKAAFTGLRRLTTLSIHHNRITKIRNGTFQQLRRLQSLHLFSNFLEEVNPRTFSGLMSLKTLSLHENHLRFIPVATFNALRRLQFLSLHRNHLTEITPGVFCQSNSLAQLYINQNKITKIHDGSFNRCNQMLKLTIGYNRLTNITQFTFEGLERLAELFMNNNNLQNLDENSFLGLRNLRQLSLKGNVLSEVKLGVFNGLRSLMQLSLSKNRIAELKPERFKGLRNVVKLFLEENNIVKIYPNAFTGLTSLQNLFLYRNQLSNIPENSFKGLDSLLELNLGVNKISSIENEAFLGLTKLQTLALNSNQLSSIPSDAFKGLSSLLKMTIYFNSISYVAEGAFDPLNSLTTLAWKPSAILARLNPRLRKLQSNNLHCDCNARWLQKWLRKRVKQTATSIPCASPFNVTGKDLVSVAKNLLKCDPIQASISPEKLIESSGGEGVFKCSVKPGAGYTWMHNGKKIDKSLGDKYFSTTDGVLQVKNVSAKDEGQIVCLAQNNAGLAVVTSKIEIGDSPRIVQYPNEEVTIEKPLKSLVLPCKAEGSPKPDISWIKDGRVISADDNHFITTDGSLVVLSMKLQHQGIYTCTASNSLGKVSVSTKVYLGQASMCLPSCRRDSGYCVVKHVCECLPEFKGPSCEFRKNTVTDSKTSQNSTVSEKAALVPKSADWAYETYDVDIAPAGSGDQDTSNNDASEDDGDIDVAVEEGTKVVPTTAAELKTTKTKPKAKKEPESLAEAAKLKPSKSHLPSHATPKTSSTNKIFEKTSNPEQKKVSAGKNSQQQSSSLVRISRSSKLRVLKMGLQVIDGEGGSDNSRAFTPV